MSTEPTNPEVPDEDRLDEPQTQFGGEESDEQGPVTEDYDDLVDEETAESFPASDPPANY